MEMNSPKTEKNNNGPHPLWMGCGVSGAIFVVVMIGVTLLQFFLQFALASGTLDTSEFWIQGIWISFIWGSIIGIPLAVVGGLLAGGVAWLQKMQQKKSG